MRATACQSAYAESLFHTAKFPGNNYHSLHAQSMNQKFEAMPSIK